MKIILTGAAGLVGKAVLFACLGVGILLSSCNTSSSTLQDGDLLFCVADNSVMSNAIVDATQKEKVNYDHVAIYVVIDNTPSVIEANPKGGVISRSLDDFMENAIDINGGKGITVMRVTQSIDLKAAIQRARQFIGQPYDWSYLPDNEKLYCSELVYECYLNNDGNPLFEANPMTFKDSKGNIPDFWVDLFKRLGEPVPEGVIGTNPNDLSQSPALEEVHRFFKTRQEEAINETSSCLTFFKNEVRLRCGI